MKRIVWEISTGGAKTTRFTFRSRSVLCRVFIYASLSLFWETVVYKEYPALYAIKTIRLLSGGVEIYSCDNQVLMGDYMQSLTDEQLRAFGKTYLGHQDSMDGTTRDVMIPLLLPNSAYMGRNGHDTRGHGVFPCYLGTNKLEIQLTLNTADYLCADPANVAGSIENQCVLMYHEVQMTGLNKKRYQDLRGGYSIVNRRFTELTSGWVEYGTPNAVEKVRHSQPQGTVTEIQIIAVANNADASRHTFAYIRPTSIKCTADAIVQRFEQQAKG